MLAVLILGSFVLCGLAVVVWLVLFCRSEVGTGRCVGLPPPPTFKGYTGGSGPVDLENLPEGRSAMSADYSACSQKNYGIPSAIICPSGTSDWTFTELTTTRKPKRRIRCSALEKRCSRWGRLPSSQ